MLNFWSTLKRGKAMGMVYAEITLKNAFDEEKAEEGLIKEYEVRSITVNAIVDTGAASLVINEDLRQKLGLGIAEERSVKLADGRRTACKLTKAVDVHWKDRHWPCAAVVIPGAETVLLGVIPLEGMDLMVNPVRQELVGVHGDSVEYMAF
jgi:clan AA aspartic protease